MAAAYAFHLAESPALVRGNQRTAVAAAMTFLQKSGPRFPKDDGPVDEAIIAIAANRLDKSQIAAAWKHLSEKQI